MAQVEIPEQTREQIEQIGAADLVIALPGAHKQEELDGIWTALRLALTKLTVPASGVLVHSSSLAIESEPGQPLRALPFPLATEPSADPVESISGAYRAAIAIGKNLGARCCTVIASDPGTVTPQWIYALVRPVLELDFDLVAPCYAQQKWEGLLNRSVLAPLLRALYGRQIQHPLGPDFGFSARLVQHLSGGEPNGRPASRERTLTSIATEAVCGDFEVCQARLGARVHAPTDWTNVSSVLPPILGPLFLDIERNAVIWQRTRESRPVPVFGKPETAGDETTGIDAARLIESFQLGCRNLRDIWEVIFSPSTLLELSKLARPATDRFRMADDLWVRVIYDLALGHRLRAINRDHLLRAMTPLYLAWVASYALEMETATPAAVEQRLERLSVAYEKHKSYFLSRWRWPDRFNP